MDECSQDHWLQRFPFSHIYVMYRRFIHLKLKNHVINNFQIKMVGN